MAVVKDYSLFDVDVYLKTYYSGLSRQDDLMSFFWRSLHSSFTKVDLHGDRLLDIGTGPSVCSVISAAPRFKEIYLSDYLGRNRSFLRKWLNGTASHSFQTVFEYFLKLEGKKLHWSVREAELKSKVKDVLPCDLTQASIFEEDIGQFDVITSSLCLDAAANDVACYRQICRKIASLVKRDGYVVIAGMFEHTFYTVGEHKFFAVYLTENDVITSWKEAGFSVVHFEKKMAPADEGNPLYDFGGAFVLVARKH